MQRNLLIEAKKYIQSNRRHRAWQKVVRVMAGCVVFCTTYALILPAITMEQEALCGYKEHTHSEECYVQTSHSLKLTCSPDKLGLHVHSESCLDADGNTICGLADYVAHTHTADCMDENGVVVCAFPEIGQHVHDSGCYSVPETVTKSHTHSDSCYSKEKGEQICTAVQQEAHTHSETCYAAEKELVCTTAETAGHVHSDSCYTTENVLACTTTESAAHTHGDGCYTAQKKLICGQAEQEAHTHGDNCYETPTICGLIESAGHTHTDACYAWKETLICGLEETPIPEPKLICTTPIAKEHVHSADCFEIAEEPLTCELEESEEHTHTALCYGTWELICPMEEHEHTLECFSDPEADLETAQVWERTFKNVKLTGVWADDVLAIAKTQLGYTESTRNYVVWEDGTTHGYTRYGDWYGSPYGDWCAMFVSFCIHYAEIDGVPLNWGCRTWIEELSKEELDLYRKAGEYDPKPGDIIFFDWEEADGTSDDLADHVGLVAELIPATGTEPAKIKTIEGNSSNQVKYNTYDADDTEILGYGIMPEAPEEQEPELVLTEQALTATIYTDSAYETVSEDAMVITVTGQLPEGATVAAYPVTVDAGDQQVLFAYDISILLADGTLWSPEEGSVTVDFVSPKLAEDCEGTLTQAYYLPEEGEPQPVDTTVTEDGVSFTTDHFSTYYAVARALALADVEGETTEPNFALDQFYTDMMAAGANETVKLTGKVEIDRYYVSNFADPIQNSDGTVYKSSSAYSTNSNIPAIIQDYVTSARISANEPQITEGVIRYGVIPWYESVENFVAIAPQWTIAGGAATFNGVMVYGKLWNQNISVYEETTENDTTTGKYTQINGWKMIGGNTSVTTLSPYDTYTLVVHRQDSEEPGEEYSKNYPQYIILSYSLYNASGDEVSSGAVQIKGEATLDRTGSVGVYASSGTDVSYSAVSTTAKPGNANTDAVFTIDKTLTLDLAGYTITQPRSQSLFNVTTNGNLTIKDSAQQQTETTTEITVPTVEVVETSGNKITYNVMTSSVTDSAVGATSEVNDLREVTYNSISATIGSETINAATTSGTINANGSTQPVFNVTGGGSLTIDGGTISGGANRAINANGGNVTVNGGTITGFTLAGADGGAIWIGGGTVLNLNGGAIRGNQANNGGAVYATGVNTVINIGSDNGKKVYIDSNTAQSGGAIYAYDAAKLNICTSGSGNQVSFTGNVATINGAAICSASTADIDIGTAKVGEGKTANTILFSGNNANGDGGAIWVNQKVNINIATGDGNNVVISGNSAKTGSGGAIYAWQANAVNIASGTNNKVVISKNTAQDGNGGAIWTNGSTKINICTSGSGNQVSFIGNKAGDEDTAANGGAICSGSTANVDIGSPVGTDATSSNNTILFSGNEATGDGGAIWTDQKVDINICSGTSTANNKAILQGNKAGTDGGAIYAHTSKNINISSATGTGNVTALSGNTATSGNGGAIYVYDFDVLNLCTGAAGNQAIISGNKAVNGNGGGIYTQEPAPALAEGETTPPRAEGGKINIGTAGMKNHNDFVISGNEALCGGGFFAVGDCQLMMNGGYITLNKSSGEWNYLVYGGGGLYLSGRTVMNMFDGYITGNEADRGGGIFTQHQGTVEFHMSGGFVSKNTARVCEGGGICIESGTMAYFLADEDKNIYITNNVTKSEQHWGGGGLFIADGGYGIARQMLVTDNTAGGYGGGLAGCSTGRIHLSMKDGAAIYGNTADGLHTSGESSAKNFDRLYATINEVFNSHGYEDYFCALNSEISGGMLGGNPAFWSGSADGVPVVSNSTQDILISAYIMGLTANPTEAGKLAAQAQATFYINGNSSYTHGGGALINGYLITGDTNEINLSTSLKLNGNKALVKSDGSPADPVQVKDEEGNPLYYADQNGNTTIEPNEWPVTVPMEHERFSFSVIDAATGAVMATGHNEEDGSIFFSEILSFTQEGVYQCYVLENDPEDPTVTWDTTIYRLTITIKKETLGMIERLVGIDEIKRNQYVIDKLLIEKYNGEKSVVDVEEEEWETVLLDEDPENYDNAPSEVTIGGSAAFTNMVRGDSTSVKVTKKWADNGTNRPKSVTVQLYQTAVTNGGSETSEYGDPVILGEGAPDDKDGDPWTYEWGELPVKSGDGETTYTYTVVEEAVDNYVPEYTTRTDVEMTGIFVPMQPSDKIEVGGKYLIVSPDGDYALYRKPEHNDKGFDNKDKISVKKQTEPYTFNDVVYTDYYRLEDIPSTSVYTARSVNKTYPILAAGVPSGESCLLVQAYPAPPAEPTTYLKDCADYTYGSMITYSAGHLVGFEGWENFNSPYTVIYQNEHFDAVSQQSTSADGEITYAPALVYKLLEKPASGTTTIVITNRLAEHLAYNLDVTKYSGITNDKDELDVTLADAKFQLQDANGTPLYFTKTSATVASYQLAEGGTEGAVTELVTDKNGKLILRGLPEADYTLVETEAPRGYLLADPVVITSRELTEGGYTYAFDVVDPPMTYTLPETGGTGTYLYTMGGLMLTMAAAILLYSKKKRGKEDYASS